MNFKKHFLTLFLLAAAIEISTSQPGWIVIPTGISQTLNAIHFMNANTGIIVGNSGTILKTTNAGFNWTPVTPPPPTIQSFFDVFFTVSLDAFIVDDRGGINKSSNAGSN